MASYGYSFSLLVRKEITMFIRNHGHCFVFGLALIAFSTGALAEKTVYKWYDDDGVVHFGDSPPDASISSEALLIPKSPPPPTPSEPPANVPAAAQPVVESSPAPDEAEMPALYEKTDISKLSIIDLNARCDEARERMISPMRDAEIAKCQQDKREDPAWCERFNADFGEGGRTVTGSIRPRLFADLPQCEEALDEINRRRR
jgi:hypothetical protein